MVKEDIGHFLTYLSVEKGFSENTVAAYRNDLAQLLQFAEDDAKKRGVAPAWSNFNRQVMLGYLLHLKERGYAATTLARKVAATKSFTVLETSTSLGPALASTRAPMCTAIPPTLLSTINSHSPVWRPARSSRSNGLTASMQASATGQGGEGHDASADARHKQRAPFTGGAGDDVHGLAGYMAPRGAL